MDTKKIGILYICTGEYSIFWKDFYLSLEKNFIPDAEKHYFVFTDNERIDFESENPKIHKIYQENLGWPDNTLMRFHIFLKNRERVSKMDYLFFFNANLLILKKITSEEFLPTGNQELLATIHPGFYNKTKDEFTYERNKRSTACIKDNEGNHYYAGGLNGGKSAVFLEAMDTLRKNIDTDTSNNITAKWHDESHWNKYLINKSNIKILPPSYLYPEGKIIPFEQIVLVRDKKKYGGHNALRRKKNTRFLLLKNKIHKNSTEAFNFFTLMLYPFIYRRAIFSNITTHPLKNESLLIISIAFNNVDTIKTQHKSLKDNLEEKFKYIVVDNSSSTEDSNLIKKYCLEQDLPFVKLPKNPFTTDPSKSHGSALNWAYKNIIKKYTPTFWGFIDHDIFPYKQTLITPLIKNGLFGLIQERNEKWYVWPGFCFFKYNYTKKTRLNFMPCSGLDTGGQNYYSLYKKINKNTIHKIKQTYFDLEKEERLYDFNDSRKIVEVIGDWVHIIGISNWNKKNVNKNNNLDDIINTVRNNF